MKPSELEIVIIKPTKISSFIINRLEIDLNHINYGLNPVTKDLNKRVRSNFTIEEVVKIFESLNGLKIRGTEGDDYYRYFATEVVPNWSNSWFRIIFCVKMQKPKTAGVITIYRVK